MTEEKEKWSSPQIIPCFKCHRYFNSKTGEKVKDLEHIKDISSNENTVCNDCKNSLTS